MAINDDWFYTELNRLRHRWDDFVTAAFVVGGRVAIDGTVTTQPGDSAVQLIDETGTAYGVKNIDGKIRTSSMPYGYDIAEGNVPGHEAFGTFGERTAVAVVTTGADVWRGVANAIPIPAAAGEQLEIISTSAADDGVPAGTGVQTVAVHYLTAAGVEAVETVTLNGLGAVALTETNVRFVQGMHAATVGSGGAAAGDIKLYKQGAPATVYARITTGGNRDLSTQMMVPAGHTFYMTQWSATATASKPVAMRLRATADHGTLIPSVFLTQDTAFMQDAVYNREFTIPLAFPAFTIIKVSAYATQAGAEVSASWRGWIET